VREKRIKGIRIHYQKIIDKKQTNMTKDEICEMYSKTPLLRAFINAIPYIGGSLDIVLSEQWNAIYERRVEDLLYQLSEDLKNLEDKVDKEYITSEDFFDLAYKILQESVKTRLKEKRILFSKIIRDSITTQRDTQETEEVIDIIISMNQKDLCFLRQIEKFTETGSFHDFTGEKFSNFINDNNFSIDEVVRMLYRFAFLGILNYETTTLTLRKNIIFSKNPIFSQLISYLNE
jgi:hypothetical protein